jgi:DNA-binding NtrC family response regulator
LVLLATQRILVVEPDSTLRARLRQTAAGLATVDADAKAPAARTHLLGTPYDWLVTNIRLEAYNGLHLAYLARAMNRPLTIVIYGDPCDLALAREAQRLGAFYESRSTITRAVGRYLRALLPTRDRRDAAQRDRRAEFRGGRRSYDVASLSH